MLRGLPPSLPAATAPLAQPDLRQVPDLAFLDVFPPSQKAHPKWASVQNRMKLYLDCCKNFRGADQKKLLLDRPDAVKAAVDSMKIYSALEPATANAMAFKREVTNIGMTARVTAKDNRAILGGERSFISENSEVRKPGNQVSLAMRVPFLTENGTVPQPVVLSVSAPALDSTKQPEWKHYVKHGKLDKPAYRQAFQTIAGHIASCAQGNPGHRIVLSAFGTANFLRRLDRQQQEVAKSIAREEFEQMIKDLQGKGISVAFSDASATGDFWRSVNQGLATRPFPAWAGFLATGSRIRISSSMPGIRIFGRQWVRDRQFIRWLRGEIVAVP